MPSAPAVVAHWAAGKKMTHLATPERIGIVIPAFSESKKGLASQHKDGGKKFVVDSRSSTLHKNRPNGQKKFLMAQENRCLLQDEREGATTRLGKQGTAPNYGV